MITVRHVGAHDIYYLTPSLNFVRSNGYCTYTHTPYVVVIVAPARTAWFAVLVPVVETLRPFLSVCSVVSLKAET